VTSTSLDREDQSHYDLLVTCWDGGHPPLSSAARVPVRVLDVNDNPPRFATSTYTARLTENNNPGVQVLRVVAADADEGLNAELHYTLAANVPDGAFDVDRAAGRVHALASVDRERYSSFSFAVYAVDHGTPSLTGSALVVVVIDDVNDEFPVFARDAYEFVVDENQPEAADVGSVFAVDGDVASSNGAVRYSIVNTGSGDLLPFSVESITGNVRTAAPLDREQRAEYRFQIAATDDGKPALTATVDVVVHVADENDNSPVLQFASSTSTSSLSSSAVLDDDTVVISSAAPRGFVLCRAIARDADVGVNSHVDFRLASGQHVDDAGRQFAVEPDTGKIVVASEFSGLGDGDAREYLLTVRASDGGLPSRSVDAVLRVVVNGSLPLASGDGAPSNTNRLVVANHVTIVVVIAGGSALATVALVVAIAVVRTRSRKSRCRLQQYNVQRSMTSDDAIKSTVTSFETVPLSSTYCSNEALHASSLSPRSNSHSKLANGTACVVDSKVSITSVYDSVIDQLLPRVRLVISSKEVMLLGRFVCLSDIYYYYYCCCCCCYFDESVLVDIFRDITSCAGGRHNMPSPTCKLTCDLLTLKVVSESCVTWATSMPILVFLGLSILDLGTIYATDRQTSDVRQTDVRRASSFNAPYPTGGCIIKCWYASLCTVEVCFVLNGDLYAVLIIFLGNRLIVYR